MSLSRRHFSGERIVGGACGVYLLRDVAACSRGAEFVFKPRAEESINTRKRTSKRGCEFGDAVLKERAAYLLDHGSFAGVPSVELGQVAFGQRAHSFGSVHRFIPHQCTSEDVGVVRFDVAEVHRIGLFDCRILNLDRHEGNILVARTTKDAKKVHLIPIDHGFSLPAWRNLSDVFFCWHWWKQAAVPFSDEAKAYVRALHPTRDIVTLRQLEIRNECILTYVLCSVLVQRSVDAGLCLKDLASIMQRSDEETPSQLERIVEQTVRDTGFQEFPSGEEGWNSDAVEDFLLAYAENVQSMLKDKQIEGHQNEKNVCALTLQENSDLE